MEQTIASLERILPTLSTCDCAVESYSLDYKKGLAYTRRLKGTFIVYFLINNDNIDYIGISESLYSRLIQHKLDKQFQKVLLLSFDSYNSMLEAEKQLIDTFEPPLNLMYNFRINRK